MHGRDGIWSTHSRTHIYVYIDAVNGDAIYGHHEGRSKNCAAKKKKNNIYFLLCEEMVWTGSYLFLSQSLICACGLYRLCVYARSYEYWFKGQFVRVCRYIVIIYCEDFSAPSYAVPVVSTFFSHSPYAGSPLLLPVRRSLTCLVRNPFVFCCNISSKGVINDDEDREHTVPSAVYVLCRNPHFGDNRITACDIWLLDRLLLSSPILLSSYFASFYVRFDFISLLVLLFQFVHLFSFREYHCNSLVYFQCAAMDFIILSVGAPFARFYSYGLTLLYFNCVIICVLYYVTDLHVSFGFAVCWLAAQTGFQNEQRQRRSGAESVLFLNRSLFLLSAMIFASRLQLTKLIVLFIVFIIQNTIISIDQSFSNKCSNITWTHWNLRELQICYFFFCSGMRVQMILNIHFVTKFFSDRINSTSIEIGKMVSQLAQMSIADEQPFIRCRLTNRKFIKKLFEY